MAIILRRRALGLTSCTKIREQSKEGIEVVRNDKYKPSDDVLIRWGCTSSVSKDHSEIINNATYIHTVNDKKSFRLILDSHNLCPKTWSIGIDVFNSIKDGNIEYPFIVRPKKHSQGKNVALVTNHRELLNAFSTFPDGYISEYIRKVAEYRVFVIQGRIAWMANKIPENPDALAWNVKAGSKFENVRWGNWPLKVCENALKSYSLSGLHFGGVDVMVDSQGIPYTLEVNSAPSITSPYRQSCTAKAFDWMLGNKEYSVDYFNLPEEFKSWKDVIHPAMVA